MTHIEKDFEVEMNLYNRSPKLTSRINLIFPAKLTGRYPKLHPACRRLEKWMSVLSNVNCPFSNGRIDKPRLWVLVQPEISLIIYISIWHRRYSYVSIHSYHMYKVVNFYRWYLQHRIRVLKSNGFRNK